MDELTAALEAVVEDLPAADLLAATRTLIAGYRSATEPAVPALDTPAAAAAYAAYRMPATYAAIRASLSAAASAHPLLAPRTCLDIGGGTGAAVWAAVQAFPTLAAVAVLDRSGSALELGSRLAGRASAPALRRARWTRARLPPTAALPAADLVTVGYLLAELPGSAREAVVAAAARAADLVVVVEPGTPAGYRRVIDARSGLIDAGFSVLAPCPHDRTCPLLAAGPSWCHFSARLNRSARHRQLKGGTLGHEDEKFSYVVAVRDGIGRRPDRVIRHPRFGKGRVDLELCTAEDGIASVRVTRRNGAAYRAARGARWGSRWTTPDPIEPGG